MASVYQDVIPSLIENTKMRLRIKDGNPNSYWITPVEGYVLHDNARDWNVTDPVTGETTHYLGYSHGIASCPVSYDFTANPREFFAVLEDSVPADQIFSGHINA